MLTWRVGVPGYIARSSSRRRTWLSVGIVGEGLDVGIKALGEPVETPFKARIGVEGGFRGEPFGVLFTEEYGTEGHALRKGLGLIIH